MGSKFSDWACPWREPDCVQNVAKRHKKLLKPAYGVAEE